MKVVYAAVVVERTVAEQSLSNSGVSLDVLAKITYDYVNRDLDVSATLASVGTPEDTVRDVLRIGLDSLQALLTKVMKVEVDVNYSVESGELTAFITHKGSQLGTSILTTIH